jgi:hypothetical protein
LRHATRGRSLGLSGGGNRNDPVNTAFALLTLRRATVPSRTTLSR